MHGQNHILQFGYSATVIFTLNVVNKPKKRAATLFPVLSDVLEGLQNKIKKNNKKSF